MPLRAKELSPIEISRLKTSGHHAVGGIAGLYLYVNEKSGKSWVLRAMVGTRRRHMGLGSYPEVSLAQAKEKARKARSELEAGVDPIFQRQEHARQLAAEQATQKTFEQATDGYLDAHGDTWRNDKHRAQWRSSLQAYAYPIIGSMLVKNIRQEEVLEVLQPIWKAKNETASRVRGRIESVLDWATVKKYRIGENPARWKGHLEMLLPAPNKVKKVVHHKALPMDEMPRFTQALQAMEGQAARALELLILCASRSGEIRGAVWTEFDLDAEIWTIPGKRMKAGAEHRVPLSSAAITLLNSLPRHAETELLFPSSKGTQMSDMTMTAVLRRMKVDAVPHGFRSTFRDWARERTSFERDLAEQALAHTLENKVEAAYRRGDAIEKRRLMMTAWAAFCGM